MESGLKITVITMQWFSFTAPQHPKKAITKIMTPTTIKTIGAD